VIIISAFEAPTVVASLDDLAMMGQAVEQRGRHFGADFITTTSEFGFRHAHRHSTPRGEFSEPDVMHTALDAATSVQETQPIAPTGGSCLNDSLTLAR